MEYVLAILMGLYLFGGLISNGRELRASLRRYYAETAGPPIQRESSAALLRAVGFTVALTVAIVLGFVVAFL